MKHRSTACVIVSTLSAMGTQPGWCDQWTGALTPTSAQASNLNGALATYVTTTQPVVNPANCVATDGWVTVDPVFSKEALADGSDGHCRRTSDSALCVQHAMRTKPADDFELSGEWVGRVASWIWNRSVGVPMLGRHHEEPAMDALSDAHAGWRKFR